MSERTETIFPVTDNDRYRFYCEPCGRAFSSAEKMSQHRCPADVGGSGMKQIREAHFIDERRCLNE